MTSAARRQKLLGVGEVHSAMKVLHRMLNDHISAVNILNALKNRFETRRKAIILVCVGVIDLIDQSVQEMIHRLI
jgi:hypothetical protein